MSISMGRNLAVSDGANFNQLGLWVQLKSLQEGLAQHYLSWCATCLYYHVKNHQLPTSGILVCFSTKAQKKIVCTYQIHFVLQ